MAMQYSLAKSGSYLISNIARSLEEDIKLNYTIDRLCDNLSRHFHKLIEYLQNSTEFFCKNETKLENILLKKHFMI